MRICLSAFSCEPHAGSEQGNGWTWAEALSRHNEVTVLTDPKFREPIERQLARTPRSSLRVEYVGPGVVGTVGLQRWRFYRRWHRYALERARSLHDATPFDVAHHVTFAAHRVPSHLWRLGIPFIFGPVGGGEGVSARFYMPSLLGWRESGRELRRWVANEATRFDHELRTCARAAQTLVVTTQETLQDMPGDTHHKALVLPSAILHREDLRTITSHRAVAGPRTGLSVMYAGRLQGWKGGPLAVRAFAGYATTHPDAQLHIFGDGPMRARLEDQTVRLGVRDRVTFHGRIPRSQLLEEYARHHVFLFPSLHDSSGFTPIEAMAAGLPVVCLDAGGPGASVPLTAGIRVPPTTPSKVVVELERALARLTRDPNLWAEMSEAARRHATDPALTPTIEEMIRRIYGATGFDIDV